MKRSWRLPAVGEVTISRNQTVEMAFYVNMALDNGVTASDSRR